MIDSRIEELIEGGYEVLQRGRVLAPGAPGVAFADRVEGFSAFRVRSGDTLIDDEHQWAHLRLGQP